MLFRSTGRMLLLLVLSSVSFTNAFRLYAQESAAVSSDEVSRGIKLYQEGDVKQAVSVLRAAVKNQKENAEAWLYLGLALTRNKDFGGARKAYETALKLNPHHASARVALAWSYVLSGNLEKAQREVSRALEIDPQSAEAYFVLGTVNLKNGDTSQALEKAEQAIKLNPQHAPSYLLKSQAIVEGYAWGGENRRVPVAGRDRREYFQRAADSLETYLKLVKADEDVEVWREQLKSLRAYAGPTDVLSPREVSTRARILKKPEPSFTPLTTDAGIGGSVQLMAVLGGDGKVKDILVLKSLPYGLTKAAVEAARKIQFEPATKDGQPVSQLVRLEYYFNFR